MAVYSLHLSLQQLSAEHLQESRGAWEPLLSERRVWKLTRHQNPFVSHPAPLSYLLKPLSSFLLPHILLLPPLLPFSSHPPPPPPPPSFSLTSPSSFLLPLLPSPSHSLPASSPSPSSPSFPPPPSLLQTLSFNISCIHRALQKWAVSVTK